MIEYVILPIVCLIVAMSSIHQVFRVTGSARAAGITGFLSFIAAMWMIGHPVYGCILAVTMFAFLVVFQESPGQS